MKLEDQVCSLGLSRKLKELGFKQESLFWWIDDWKGNRKNCEISFENGSCKKPKSDVVDIVCSAYTVAELGEMLPGSVQSPNKESYIYFNIFKHDGYWEVGYQCYDSFYYSEIADTEADARAKMLIYLKKTNLE